MSIDTLMEWLEVASVALGVLVLVVGGLFFAFLLAVTESSKNTPQVPTPSSRSKEDEKYENLKKSLEGKQSFWLNPTYDIDGKRKYPSRFPQKPPLGEDSTH